MVLQNRKERSQENPFITPSGSPLSSFLRLWLLFADVPMQSVHFHVPRTYSCLGGVPHFPKTQWSVVKASPSPGLEVSSNCLYWLCFCLLWPLMAIRILRLSEGLRVRK